MRSGTEDSCSKSQQTSVNLLTHPTASRMNLGPVKLPNGTPASTLADPVTLATAPPSRANKQQGTTTADMANVSPRQTETFGLPRELFWMITVNLSFADRFFLSQTCSALRHSLRRDWRGEFVLRLPRAQTEIAEELAEGLLNVWYCCFCGRLHRVDTRDYPSNHEWAGDSNSTRGCAVSGFSREQLLPSFRFEPGTLVRYPIKMHHSQLLRKYERYRRTCGAHKYEVYSQNLMRAWVFPGTLLPGESVVFRPKLYGDSLLVEKQFLFLEEANIPFSSFKSESLYAISLCRHVDRHQHKLLRESIWKALQNPGQAIEGSCEHCPTDYEVVVKEGTPTSLKVIAWSVTKQGMRIGKDKCHEENERQHAFVPGQIRDVFTDPQVTSISPTA